MNALESYRNRFVVPPLYKLPMHLLGVKRWQLFTKHSKAPHPNPLPGGEGESSSARRGSSDPDPYPAQRACCSLSPRERVGVRGLRTSTTIRVSNLSSPSRRVLASGDRKTLRWSSRSRLKAGLRTVLLVSLLQCTVGALRAADGEATIKGDADPDQTHILIQGSFPTLRPGDQEARLIVAARWNDQVQVGTDVITQNGLLELRVIQGRLKEIALPIQGEIPLMDVTGEGLLAWGTRQETNAQRYLVLRTDPGDPARTNWTFNLTARMALTNAMTRVRPFILAPSEPSLFNGFLRVLSVPEWEVEATDVTGLTPIEPEFFPGAGSEAEPKPLTYRFSGSAYNLALTIKDADPERRRIRLVDFKLEGDIQDQAASFTLTGRAVVRNPKGGKLMVLGGAVALTGYDEQENARLELDQGAYHLHFAEEGEFPVRLTFDALITDKDGWKQVAFTPASSALRPVRLSGLPQTTTVEFLSAAEAERAGAELTSHLQASGPLAFQWQESRPEVEGKLFFAVTGTSQISVRPGLVQQISLLDYKVMQGELQELDLVLSGPGEVTRIQGNGILSWQVTGEGDARRLLIKLNQPRKDSFLVAIHTQTPLDTFPLQFKPLRLVPEGAIRYGGHIRVVNAGAVRLEVLNAPGLAQISPTRFPEVEGLGNLSEVQQAQAFAFRFSGPAFDLDIQADNVLPELTVSELLVYHLGETEKTLDAEVELEIREAPLRELEILVPGGYSVASLNAPSLSDYTLADPAEDGTARLTLQFGQPLIGRHVLHLRLTQSHASPPDTWTLIPLQPQAVKSVRGFVGLSADAGLRLVGTQTQGLTEIATAFFPKKLKDLQHAFRLRDPNWTATVQSERLALSVQVDSLHLFSIGEGLTYGSTLFNYLISGAPVSVLRLAVPTNYANLEFVGQDIRNWQATTNGVYEVHLHAPISGTYSLLATFDNQFNPRGEELAFTGLQPLEVQSEQGHVILISTYQFQTDPVEVSAGLLTLQPGEVPTEYRLLFDAPILRAYQFTSRPFDLRLNLASLAQGETVNQVVDRATFNTRVSGEGQVLTDATYLIKSKGHSHLRVTVPKDTSLWSAKVNGKDVVPVSDQVATLIPLPQDLPPDTVIPVVLKLALKSEKPTRVRVALPAVDAPVLLSDWKVNPDEGYRLTLKGGTVRPVQHPGDISGFTWLQHMPRGRRGEEPLTLLGIGLVALAIGGFILQWATKEGRRRFGIRNTTGLVLGGAAMLLGFWMLITLVNVASSRTIHPGTQLAFAMPVQAPGDDVAIQLANQSQDDLASNWLVVWPAYLGVLAWGWFLIAHQGFGRLMGIALGWVLMFWGCLRTPNGAAAFFGALILFMVVHEVWPLLLRQWRLPRKSKASADSPDSATAGGAATLILLLPLLLAATASAQAAVEPVVVQSVHQEGTVKKDQVFLSARLKWDARKDQVLDFLQAPAVLTTIDFPKDQLKLVQEDQGEKALRLISLKAGPVEVAFTYQLPVTSQDGVNGFQLRNHRGLINQLTLQVDRADIELVSPQAVSIRPGPAAGNTTAFRVALAPVEDAWISWKPLSRDTRTEKTLFYAELFQLFIPTAGIIEGIHAVQVRPAQGQVHEMIFETPAGLTITDVQAQDLSDWKFDPDNRTLRVQLEPAPSRPFVVQLFSQFTTSPLPFEAEVGLIKVQNAAGQVGMAGVATGSEVQLDAVTPTSLSPINLEDFPGLVSLRAEQITGLTLRRAYRSSDPDARLGLKASAVQPDVRVTTQETLSLGEDRTVLAVQLSAEITRAGVFKLSFVLPQTMDVEALTGEALSHWTEVTTDGQRIITMHLKGKTTGTQNFAINLVGPGVPEGAGWSAPKLSLREADKQTGQLVVVPEQGMRLQTAEREGVTQHDPKETGIRQQGVLAFRLLQPDWRLTFDIQKVDPWIQVVSLQDVTVREGQIKATTTFEYTIENAGLKSLFVQLPANADGVRFTGEQIADSVKAENPAGETVEWEVKLRRRWIGTYTLQVHYQLPASESGGEETIVGVQARQVNLERAHLTLRTGGRLQLGIPRLPPALQPIDWRSLPASLRGLQNNGEGNFTFRAIESDYRLTVAVVRHDAEPMLPARVEQSDFVSLLSDAGQMVTHVRLVMQPGNKRLLKVQLPASAQFWFAFVNNGGVWPWQEEDTILIPLEANFKPGESAVVEFLYAVPTQSGRGGGNDFKLLGPEFDLPLENITWKVYLPEGRELDDFKGDLQLQEKRVEVQPTEVTLQSYLQQESAQQQEQTREAESLLAKANDLLTLGRQQEARKAFQSAWTLSQHDDAFNEDARVQLHNLKMQQALVGLNYRRNRVFQDEVGAASGDTNAALNILQANQPAFYTQQQVQQALGGNSVEVNGALMALAEELIEQQDAAQVAPETIRATLPEQGHQLIFTRSLLVDPWAELTLDLETSTMGGGGWAGRFGMLVLLFAGVAAFMLLMRRGRAS